MKLPLLSFYNQWRSLTWLSVGGREMLHLWPFSAPSLPRLSQCGTAKESPDFCSWVTDHRWQRYWGSGCGGGGEEGWLTSAGGQHVTPLPTGQALGSSGPLSHIAWVADKLDHVVEVELVALGEAVDWVAWVSTGNCCNQNRREVSPPAAPVPKSVLSSSGLSHARQQSTALGLTLVSFATKLCFCEVSMGTAPFPWRHVHSVDYLREVVRGP